VTGGSETVSPQSVRRPSCWRSELSVLHLQPCAFSVRCRHPRASRRS